MAIDVGQFIAAEVLRLEPRPTLQHGDVESRTGQDECRGRPRCARADDADVDLRAQRITWPPLTESVVPVTQAAPGEAKYSTASATSSAVPRRPSGIKLWSRLRS